MTIPTTEKSVTRALLISIRTPDVSLQEVEESLAELSRLVSTLGFSVVATKTQRQRSTKQLSVLGSGKLEELAELTSESEDQSQLDFNPDELSALIAAGDIQEQANVAVFDCELSPNQIRHVEAALGVEVYDRTRVIIEIFSKHARTRTAKLQVEIARLNYLTPRLRDENSGDRERQKGSWIGESAFEINSRRIRDKIADLKREIKKLQEEMQGRRSSRVEQLCVALVGYTNAGKSSLMRALTDSEVLVEDKLFATLDTTVRTLQPPTQPRILISDTVGFIKKLPHDLVASFHSTLEEAKDADLLLYVVDASDENFTAQLAVVDHVLAELNVDASNRLLLLNKVDCISEERQLALLEQYPDALQISARNKGDVALVHQEIQDFLEKKMCPACFHIPYTASGVMGEIHSKMQVTDEQYHEDGMRITLKATPVALERLHKMLQSSF
ncbi:GTP-binding protein HflX [Psychromonas ingrahamii 37]|uniref:GTPase HflX n=1 Tax=Psychromonas ingrahamii (strain DSM 17664 / CCUG 51855 / 37) TaxID=357804 RepID=A1SXB1_PSYIN|nr:GTPase HflX [Psychromonas ingrahamii]ABM04126.1 GTP-binding protein HflX [Psychromonas ingrahamii 37]